MLRITITLLILTLSLALNGQSEDTLLLRTETGIIEGNLMVPDIGAPSPVVLIIAGSGPTDRDGNNEMMKNNSLKFLAKELANKGIASLRYDKRGIGRSKDASPGEENMRIENFSEDAIEWIQVDSFPLPVLPLPQQLFCATSWQSNPKMH